MCCKSLCIRITHFTYFFPTTFSYPSITTSSKQALHTTSTFEPPNTAWPTDHPMKYFFSYVMSKLTQKVAYNVDACTFHFWFQHIACILKTYNTLLDHIALPSLRLNILNLNAQHKFFATSTNLLVWVQCYKMHFWTIQYY